MQITITTDNKTGATVISETQNQNNFLFIDTETGINANGKCEFSKTSVRVNELIRTSELKHARIVINKEDGETSLTLTLNDGSETTETLGVLDDCEIANVDTEAINKTLELCITEK